MNVTERFLKYISYDTQSDESSSTIPSTAKQKILGQVLADELAEMGLQDARMDEYGYVYAYLPGNCEGVAPIGLIAHMDTAPAESGTDIKPRVIHYEGGDIQLNETVTTTVEQFPALKKYIGDDLIVTDGTTLLGGDDKAGVAEIMCAVEYFLQHPEVKHGKICVGFTPDEEIGRGPDKFDVAGFGADYGYTVDGGEVGGIDYENFNAASAKVSFYGISSHTGDAKGKMINAGRIACEFVSMLPENEIPERTSGREGFIHLDAIKGSVTEAFLGMIIRDHDWNKFIEKKELVQKIADQLCEKYGEGTVVAEVKDTYFNMKEKILPNMFIIDKAMEAYRKNGVEPKSMAIRGGTDGATLSFMGLPCPNISTGGMNCHGIHELVSIQSMEKMIDIIIDICKAE
ncbi:MAG: peptidase T [Lachnospiraceae bacterium]|nr:peptidase T [Lachnospiraceae bacterium]